MNVWLNFVDHPGLPACTNLEILGIYVIDENGDAFASAGSLVPPRNDQTCGFRHPKTAGKLKASFVPAFYGCGSFPGAAPNDMTEGEVPSCSPPQTFNELMAEPPNGWFLDPDRGKGQIIISPKKAPFGAATGPMNPDGQTGDLRVKLKLSEVRDADGPAEGTGTLRLRARITMPDRRGTADPSDDAPMTLVDLTLVEDLVLSNGSARIDTSFDAMLNAIGHPGLPHCASVEIVAIELVDENGATFAQPGVWLAP
jgi:hypothetical protein